MFLSLVMIVFFCGINITKIYLYNENTVKDTNDHKFDSVEKDILI